MTWFDLTKMKGIAKNFHLRNELAFLESRSYNKNEKHTFTTYKLIKGQENINSIKTELRRRSKK